MSALSSLLEHDPTDASRILEAAEKILQSSSSDIYTQHIKVIALLKLDRFDDALATLRDGGSNLQHVACLEYAYALYKTGQLIAAQNIASGLKDRAGRHLEAQVSYRSEDFAQAARIYRELGAEVAAEDASELRINSGATHVQLQWSEQSDGVQASAKRPSREDLEIFETAYNAACGSLARGELVQGDMLLKRAYDMCLASDLPELEKKTELLPIQVQRLYALSGLGRTEEAKSIAEELAIEEIPDAATQQIAQVNKLALQAQPDNPYLAQRLFENLPPVPPTDNLFKMQSDLIQQNVTALALLRFKYSGVVETAKRRLGDFSKPSLDRADNSLSAASAAAKAQCELGRHGLKSVLPLLHKRPLDIGVVLTVVQQYVLTHNHEAATKVMEGFLQRLEDARMNEASALRFAPGVVAVLVSLYHTEGRKSHIRQELTKAATFWRHQSKIHQSFFRATGAYLLQSGKEEDIQEAQALFKALRESDPDDAIANAGFIAAFATTEKSGISELASQLMSIDKLTAGIDAASLERSGVPVPPSAGATLAASRKRVSDDLSKSVKKRIRQSRKPKSLEPNKKPDPERWLPLRDRSTYKPKGKKGKQKQAALTQGGISKDAADSGAETKAETAKAGGGKSKKKGKKK